ncbi:hypothetical protein [Moraxella catarrhalis]|uniref:hypothetical protein n=1 Tax=Moraxella catarrhalis TaxID=480 RepID=UPI00128D26EA|nr:hypothetical protein [Moraxella catarrhalis]MPY08880.1 hypothetical protein [Moraxella catarrhalis]
MKIFAVTASAFVALMLTACGHGHEKVHAVDRIEEAQAAALANAPKAEDMVFGDEGVSTMTTETAQADASTDVVTQEDTQMADADANATVEPTAEAQEPTETQAN